MYWIYLILFMLAVMIPDIIRGNFYILSENRLEELAIFLLGISGFLIFVFKERQLSFWESQSVRNEKRLTRATKDLVDSYSYIGEVNRKMEILMQIGLGLANRSELTKAKEKEIYASIIAAANSLMKSKNACLRFVDVESNRTHKELAVVNSCKFIKNSDLLEIGENVNFKISKSYVVASSIKEIKKVKCFLIIDGYESVEAKNANNQEMLKFLATQALFLYAYMSAA